MCLTQGASFVYSQDFEDFENIDTVARAKRNGYNKFFYKSGAISSEGTMRSGKPEGYWKNYYETGILKSEGYRRNFVLDSTWKFYNEKGFITTVMPFKNGIKSGVVKNYYDSLKLKSEEVFLNGKKQGLTVYYHPNGGITNEIPFDNGLENGIAKEYDDKGVVNRVIYYKDGYNIKQLDVNRTDSKGYKQGTWLAFYDSIQQIRWEGYYKNNKKHGTFREFSKDGNVTKVEEYVEGELIEFATMRGGRPVKVEIRKDWYPNATERIVGTYKDGVPDGVFREYDPRGNVIASTVYAEGKVLSRGILDDYGYEQGFWQYLFENGATRSEGSYVDGKKTGPWRYFHDDGTIMEEGNFENDKPIGFWKWYYERTGNLQREEFFKNGLENGEVKEYADTNVQIAEVKGAYSDGKRDGEWIYTIGDTKYIGTYSNNEEEGIWKEFYPVNRLRFEGKYHDGIENGIHKYYYENGNIKEERFYRNGLREKTWKFYAENGELIATIEYNNDKETKVNGTRLDPKKKKRIKARPVTKFVR